MMESEANTRHGAGSIVSPSTLPPLCLMFRPLSFATTTLMLLLLVHACSGPGSMLGQSASAVAQVTADDVPWQHACMEPGFELSQQPPVWWTDWRQALAANAPDTAHELLRQAAEQARTTFQELLVAEPVPERTGASARALREWMSDWVQSATPLFVTDARGFVFSDAVACPQASAYASSGDITSATQLLIEARPFLRPGSCAQRCLSALQGDGLSGRM